MSLTNAYRLPIDVAYNTQAYPNSAFHAHAKYEIYYFHGGAGHYLIGGRIFTLAPGDLILMHGMTLHAPNIDERGPYRRTIIHFDPTFVAELIRPPFQINVLAPFQEHGNVRLRLGGTQQEQVESLLSALCALYQQEDPLAYDRFLVKFLELLHVIHECCEVSALRAADTPSPKASNAQRIVEYLEASYMNDIHLDVLERELHLDKHYLTRLFKEVTGFTIFQYLYERRINQAKIAFLLNPAKPVTETCYEVGFKSPAHFSRAFKKKTGLTPEKFKQSLQR